MAITITRDQRGDAVINLGAFGRIGVSRKLSFSNTDVIYVHLGDKIVPITPTDWKLVSDFIESEMTELGNSPQTH